jgi:hypothetical protein
MIRAVFSRLRSCGVIPLSTLHTLCMYVHEKLELPVPAELTLHFEMMKVRSSCCFA